MTAASGIPGIMAGTKPWVRLVSILGFISVGFMMLAGIGILLWGLLQGGGVQAIALGLIYPITSILYIFPSFYLFRYASRIDDYVSGGQEIQLELALDSQRSFWKFVGILAIISIAFFLLGMLAAILIPAFLRTRAF